MKEKTKENLEYFGTVLFEILLIPIFIPIYLLLLPFSAIAMLLGGQEGLNSFCNFFMCESNNNNRDNLGNYNTKSENYQNNSSLLFYQNEVNNSYTKYNYNQFNQQLVEENKNQSNLFNTNLNNNYNKNNINYKISEGKEILYDGVMWDSPFYIIQIDDKNYYVCKNDTAVECYKRNDILGMLNSVDKWHSWTVRDAGFWHDNQESYKYINIDIDEKITYSNDSKTYFDVNCMNVFYKLFHQWARDKSFLRFKGEQFHDFNHPYDEKTVSNINQKKDKQYLYVRVKFPDSNKLYWYISDSKNVEIGQNVTIYNEYGRNIATIIETKYCTKESVPYPPEKTKHI